MDLSTKERFQENHKVYKPLCIINNMINKETQKVLKIIRAYNGSSITELTKETKLPRCQVRISIAYLLGAEKINERNVGMSKLYYEA